MAWPVCFTYTMFVAVGTKAITASEFHQEKIAKFLKGASFLLPFTGLNSLIGNHGERYIPSV